VVCRHCGHDFRIVKSLLVRLIALEDEVEALAAIPAPIPANAASFVAFAAAMAAAFCVVSTSGYFFVMLHAVKPSRSLVSYIVAIAVPPVVFGLLAGAISTRRRSPAIFLTGLALGILNFVFLWLMAPKGAGFQKLLAVGTFVIGQPLTFATAHSLGQSLRGRWPSSKAKPRPESGKPGAIQRVTANITLVADLLKALASIGGTVAGAYVLLHKMLKMFS